MTGKFPPDITDQLVSWDNPEGQVTNSDLDLSISVIRHAFMADCFDICKLNIMSRTDNKADLWW